MANEQDVMMNSFPEATDGKYFYLESEDGKQIRVTNASAARMISAAIKNDPNLLANVNFGAKTSSELASVVAGVWGSVPLVYDNNAIPSDHANDPNYMGFQKICIAYSSGESNWSGCSKAYGTLVSLGMNYNGLQIFATNNNELYFRSRYNSQWMAWKKIV